MQKIVFFTSPSKGDYTLINCLRILFPECRVEIHPRQENACKHFQAYQEDTATEKVEA